MTDHTDRDPHDPRLPADEMLAYPTPRRRATFPVAPTSGTAELYAHIDAAPLPGELSPRLAALAKAHRDERNRKWLAEISHERARVIADWTRGLGQI